MLYSIHVRDEVSGWELCQQSKSLEDFTDEDRWFFNHILEEGMEYVKMGDTMWNVQLNNNA